MDVINTKLRQMIVFKIEKKSKKLSFLNFITISPSSAPEEFLKMSSGFIMSGEVQAIRTTWS